MLRLLILTTLATACFGQLQSVEIRVSGLDCASCANSVPTRLKRVRGVATASFDAQQAIATVTLHAENAVTLSSIRDALKGLGYTPGDADVTVVGVVKENRLSLPHQAEAFILEKAQGASGRVRLEGKVAAGTDTLEVVKHAEFSMER